MSLSTYEQAELKARYRIVCRKCGGGNGTFDFQRGEVYSEDTQDADTIAFGCPDCKNNDFFISPD